MSDAIRTVTDDNRMPEMSRTLRTATSRAIGDAFRFLLGGYPPGHATLSRPSEPASAAWLPLLGLATAVLATGALGILLFEEGPVRGVGGALAAVGAVLWPILAVAMVALERTVPPPKRPYCLAVPPSEHPLWPHTEATDLVPMGDGLHVAQQPLVFHGLAVGARMTVIELGDGAVLIYSPIAHDDALEAAVRSLGTVAAIVAPNPVHHLFVGDWHEAFPEAALVAPEGLADRRPDLPITHTLTGTTPEVPWQSAQCEVAVVGGHPMHTEVALLHTPTQTLVVADLIMNIGHRPETPRSRRRMLDLAAVAERPSPPIELKLTLTDPEAMRAGTDHVATWDFTRILPAHGRPVEVDAKQAWRDAFAFLAD